MRERILDIVAFASCHGDDGWRARERRRDFFFDGAIRRGRQRTLMSVMGSVIIAGMDCWRLRRSAIDISANKRVRSARRRRRLIASSCSFSVGAARAAAAPFAAFLKSSITRAAKARADRVILRFAKTIAAAARTCRDRSKTDAGRALWRVDVDPDMSFRSAFAAACCAVRDPPRAVAASDFPSISPARRGSYVLLPVAKSDFRVAPSDNDEICGAAGIARPS